MPVQRNLSRKSLNQANQGLDKKDARPPYLSGKSANLFNGEALLNALANKQQAKNPGSAINSPTWYQQQPPPMRQGLLKGFRCAGGLRLLNPRPVAALMVYFLRSVRYQLRLRL